MLLGVGFAGVGVWQGMVVRHIHGRSSRMPHYDVTGVGAVLVGLLMVAAGTWVAWTGWKALRGEE